MPGTVRLNQIRGAAEIALTELQRQAVSDEHTREALHQLEFIVGEADGTPSDDGRLGAALEVLTGRGWGLSLILGEDGWQAETADIVGEIPPMLCPRAEGHVLVEVLEALIAWTPPDYVRAQTSPLATFPVALPPYGAS